MQAVPETLVYLNHLMQFSAGEVFSEFSHHESIKTYTGSVLMLMEVVHKYFF
jgi:hypothetical protein